MQLERNGERVLASSKNCHEYAKGFRAARATDHSTEMGKANLRAMQSGLENDASPLIVWLYWKGYQAGLLWRPEVLEKL